MTAPLPPNAILFTPPAVYHQWWAMTQQCSGLTGSLGAIDWYYVPDVETIPSSDGPVAGWWSKSPNRIVLAGDARFQGDLVRHEMLHALVQRGGHPRLEFIGRCGGVVVCNSGCLRDEAPPPPQNALHVQPTAIAVTVEVTPSTPGSAINDGHFMMIVRATNPSATPVIVDLPPSGDAGPPGSFGFRVFHGFSYSWFDERAWAVEVTRFAPGETKRHIFDFYNRDGDSRYNRPPGTYRFEGRYGDVWAPNGPTVTVSP